MSPEGAWAACLLLACTFVGTLYVLDSGIAARDHPATIKRRFCAVGITCAVAWVPCYLSLSHADTQSTMAHTLAALGLRVSGATAAAAAAAAALTLTLFLGSLLQSALDGTLRWPGAGLSALQTTRVLVVAPLAEEWCFRACMLPLLLQASIAPTTAVLACPLFFGAAHLHHAWELLHHRKMPPASVALSVGLMFTYTTLFGWFAAFLFYRTRQLAAPVVTHVLCNHLGLPSFHELPSHPRRRLLAATYVIGIAAFAVLLLPLTAPELYAYR